MIEAATNETKASAFDELVYNEYSRPQTCFIPPSPDC
jgi:hypothetical protein